MATLLTGLVSGLGTAASGIGSVVGGLGKGFLSGAGGAAGLGDIVKAVPGTSSIWSTIGSALGKQAMSGGGRTSSSPSLPNVDTSTRVSQSSGYQGRKKKSQMETLLEQLARR